MFDMQRDSAMLDEGLAREVVNLVQKLRKKGGLVPTDSVTVFYRVESQDSDLGSVIASQKLYIENLLKAPFQSLTEKTNGEVVVEEVSQLKGSPGNIRLRIVKGALESSSAPPSKSMTESTKRKSTAPSTQAAKVVKSDSTEKTDEEIGSSAPPLKSEKKNQHKSKNEAISDEKSLDFNLPRNSSLTPCVR